MCQACFDRFVADEGFPDISWQQQLQIIGCALAILHHPDVQVADGRCDYAGGGLHVPVEDDGYEVDISDGSIAGAAWNQLSTGHRAMVCALLNGYEVPDGRRFTIHRDGLMVVTSRDGFRSEASYADLVPG
jgi:hypothetical protein